MTLRELLVEIQQTIERHPEILDLPVFQYLDDPEEDGFEIDRLCLHDPDGEGFDYITFGTP